MTITWLKYLYLSSSPIPYTFIELALPKYFKADSTKSTSKSIDTLCVGSTTNMHLYMGAVSARHKVFKHVYHLAVKGNP